MKVSTVDAPPPRTTVAVPTFDRAHHRGEASEAASCA